MTPPRSISPTSTHGHIGGQRRSPYWRCRPARRLTSAGQPAPSTSTRSASADRSAIALQHLRQQLRLQRVDSPRALALPHTAPCTMTWAPISLCGFSSTGFMCTDWRHAAGARLQRLGAADLAAIGRHRGVVRHVLRLERPHLQALPREGAAEPGDHQRLADVGSGALEHDRGRQLHRRHSRRIPLPSWERGGRA